METERIDDERKDVFICTCYERAINYVHDSNTKIFSQFEINKTSYQILYLYLLYHFKVQ